MQFTEQINGLTGSILSRWSMSQWLLLYTARITFPPGSSSDFTPGDYCPDSPFILVLSSLFLKKRLVKHEIFAM